MEPPQIPPPMTTTRAVSLMASDGSDPRGSGVSLDGLQVDEDTPQHIVAQDALPDGHALVEAPLAHGLVEHRGRLRSVTEREPAQVERPLSLDRVWPMAVRAVLVEQASALRDHVGGTLHRVRGSCLLGRGCLGPGETEGGAERRDAQRAAEPGKVPRAEPQRAAPSGLAARTLCPRLRRDAT